MANNTKSSDSNREWLALHLTGMAAHISFERAVRDFPVNLAGKRIPGLGHTAWGLLWHLTVCQEDILLYALNEAHVSPPYPSGLWPEEDGPADSADWERTVRKFEGDLAAIVRMVRDPERRLDAPMRPGLDETLLQMAGLVIDHNSYHIGQLVDLRMLLGVPVKDW
jgi:hypothetical protein